MTFKEVFIFIAGVLLGYFGNFYFYKLSSKRQKEDIHLLSGEHLALNNKLDDVVKTIILGDSRKMLTVEDLNNLLEEHIYDEQNKGFLKYKKCPLCGSDNFIIRKDMEIDSEGPGAPYEEFNCNDCGHHEIGYEDFSIRSN
jgi:DNA-directed RNA polymerase subunit M/transcription elongation factor TFIIS